MLRKFTFSTWRSSIYQPLETRHQRLWRGRDFISQFVDSHSHQRYSNQSTRIDKVQRSMYFQIKFFSHRELFKEDVVIVIIDAQTLQKIFVHILILQRTVFFFSSNCTFHSHDITFLMPTPAKHIGILIFQRSVSIIYQISVIIWIRATKRYETQYACS